jgi:anti-sigma factor RsiW
VNCSEARENLAAYLDGEIEGAPRQAVDGHLAVCEACSAEMRAQAAAWRLLDALPAPPAPAGFAARVAERARSAPPARRGRILGLPLPAVAAAAAILLAAGGTALLLNDGPSPQDLPDDRILDDLAVLESMDVLQDGDADSLDRLADLGDEDLGVLGD